MTRNSPDHFEEMRCWMLWVSGTDYSVWDTERTMTEESLTQTPCPVRVLPSPVITGERSAVPVQETSGGHGPVPVPCHVPVHGPDPGPVHGSSPCLVLGLRVSLSLVRYCLLCGQSLQVFFSTEHTVLIYMYCSLLQVAVYFTTRTIIYWIFCTNLYVLFSTRGTQIIVNFLTATKHDLLIYRHCSLRHVLV